MAVINLRTRATLIRGPIARRPGHMLLTAVVGVIAVAGVLAGCGTAAAPRAGGTSSAGSHGPAAKAILTIKATDKAGGKVTRWTLRCDPPGGTAPDPAAACKTLFGAKDTFAPVRHRVMCPMIMVSGKQIVMDGTWFGKKVHRVIIDGGCDLSVFNSLAKTFN
jgi:hypothetical protein